MVAATCFVAMVGGAIQSKDMDTPCCMLCNWVLAYLLLNEHKQKMMRHTHSKASLSFDVSAVSCEKSLTTSGTSQAYQLRSYESIGND